MSSPSPNTTSGQPHILMLPSWYPSRNYPANGNFIENHIRAIARFCPVSVLFVESHPDIPKGHIEKEYSEPSGVPTWKLYYPKSGSRIPLVRDLVQFKQFLKAAWLGYETITRDHGTPDLIHLHVIWKAGLIAYFLKMAKKIPFVITEHSTLFMPQRKENFSKVTRLLIQKIGNTASYIMPVSEDLKNSMRKAGIKNHYQVIPNVVDPHTFYPVPKSTDSTPFTFLHVSNLRDEQKNFSGILEAIEILAKKRNDFILKVINDGDGGNHFPDWVKGKKLEPYVRFLPAMAQNEVAEAMRSSHCLVMFSQYETFSIVIAEALMCGLPIIYTDAGGLTSELDLETSGIKVKTGDTHQLAQSMSYMVDHHQNFKPLEISQKFTQQFMPETIGKAYLKIYREVLSL